MDPIEPKKINLKKTLLVCAAIVLTALLVGGGVWYAMDVRLAAEKEAYSQTVGELEQRIKEAEQAASVTSDDNDGAAVEVISEGPEDVLKLFMTALLNKNYSEGKKYITQNVIDYEGGSALQDHFTATIKRYETSGASYKNSDTYTVTVKEVYSDEPCTGDGPCIQSLDVKTSIIKKGGEWVIDGYAFPYGIGKPVIYLYPREKSLVDVLVNPKGGMTYSIPEYKSGWRVLADPSGVLTAGGRSYPYLFWESTSADINIPANGFMVQRDNVASFLDEKLRVLGLNVKESADFKEFWLPRMSEKPYYFVNFIPQREIDRLAPLAVNPKPDSTIRVLMYFRGSNTWKPTLEQHLIPVTRKGFSVVEWGGIFSN